MTGLRSFPGVLAYCVSKSAIDQLTRCAALELAPKGVRVNAVNPGVVISNLHRRGGMNEENYAAFLEHSKATHPLGRPGEPHEIADLIFFLASTERRLDHGRDDFDRRRAAPDVCEVTFAQFIQLQRQLRAAQAPASLGVRLDRLGEPKPVAFGEHARRLEALRRQSARTAASVRGVISAAIRAGRPPTRQHALCRRSISIGRQGAARAAPRAQALGFARRQRGGAGRRARRRRRSCLSRAAAPSTARSRFRPAPPRARRCRAAAATRLVLVHGARAPGQPGLHRELRDQHRIAHPTTSRRSPSLMPAIDTGKRLV